QEKPDASQRNAFERGVLQLRHALTLYRRLRNTVQPQDITDLPAELRRLDAMLPAEEPAMRQLAEAVRLYGEWKAAQSAPRPPARDLTPDVQRALLAVLEHARLRRDGEPFDREALARLVQEIDRYDITVQ